VIAFFVYFIAFPGALVHNEARYFYAIVVPWACLGLACGLGRLGSDVAVTVAIAVLGVHLALKSIEGDRKTRFPNEVRAAAEWVDAHVPADAVLLVHDAGGISEFAHRRAVDIVGLKTPSSIAAHERWTWPSCGARLGNAVVEIARNSGATYFVAVTGWDEALRGGLEANGFVLTPVRTPGFVEWGYTVYRLSPSP
jgi:GNAT superfamily N-acetyltransferase